METELSQEESRCSRKGQETYKTKEMKHSYFKLLLLICSASLLIEAFPAKHVTTINMKKSHKGAHNNRFVSVCPTDLRLTQVRRASLFRTREIVPLSNLNGRSIEFNLGRCISSIPIAQAFGICTITMQRHRAYIIATNEQIRRNHFQNCRSIPGRTGVKECSEWIELPGLCQHKINP